MRRVEKGHNRQAQKKKNLVAIRMAKAKLCGESHRAHVHPETNEKDTYTLNIKPEAPKDSLKYFLKLKMYIYYMHTYIHTNTCTSP